MAVCTLRLRNRFRPKCLVPLPRSHSSSVGPHIKQREYFRYCRELQLGQERRASCYLINVIDQPGNQLIEQHRVVHHA